MPGKHASGKFTFTAEQRKAAYGVIAAVFTLAVAYGVVTAENAEAVMRALEQLAPVAVALFARHHVETE
uniref:Mycobacterial 2 TMS Phage Holin (M2 Hol) Family n=1 Tax=Siphoviridae sp. ct45W1 TaxID=2823562 RepID=A0A8S5L6X2_9CAUD|nr:MAG TPA: Mycobacterial 2 TMS Phage Holin (M2 Hol) Family [Siphoviridae sp. ct45W1]